MQQVQVDKLLHFQGLGRDVLDDLGEEVGDVVALGDEREQALQGLALLGVEPAVEQRGDADVLGVVVEVGVGTDPEHHRRRLAQRLRRGSELREHAPGGGVFRPFRRLSGGRSSGGSPPAVNSPARGTDREGESVIGVELAGATVQLRQHFFFPSNVSGPMQ